MSQKLWIMGLSLLPVLVIGSQGKKELGKPLSQRHVSYSGPLPRLQLPYLAPLRPLSDHGDDERVQHCDRPERPLVSKKDLQRAESVELVNHMRAVLTFIQHYRTRPRDVWHIHTRMENPIWFLPSGSAVTRQEFRCKENALGFPELEMHDCSGKRIFFTDCREVEIFSFFFNGAQHQAFAGTSIAALAEYVRLGKCNRGEFEGMIYDYSHWDDGLVHGCVRFK